MTLNAWIISPIIYSPYNAPRLTAWDVRGYFYRSLLDNLERAEGVNRRFRRVHVDFPTQRRILEKSAHFYRRVIEANAVAYAKYYQAAHASRKTISTRRQIELRHGRPHQALTFVLQLANLL